MVISLNDLEVSEKLDSDGELRFEIFEEMTFLGKKELRILRNHIDELLFEDVVGKVKNGMTLDDAKNGFFDTRFKNSDIARVISLYNKLK